MVQDSFLCSNAYFSTDNTNIRSKQAYTARNVTTRQKINVTRAQIPIHRVIPAFLSFSRRMIAISFLWLIGVLVGRFWKKLRFLSKVTIFSNKCITYLDLFSLFGLLNQLLHSLMLICIDRVLGRSCLAYWCHADKFVFKKVENPSGRRVRIWKMSFQKPYFNSYFDFTHLPFDFTRMFDDFRDRFLCRFRKLPNFLNELLSFDLASFSLSFSWILSHSSSVFTGVCWECWESIVNLLQLLRKIDR